MATATADKTAVAKITPIGAIKAKHRFESLPGKLSGQSLQIDIEQDWWADPPDDRKVEGRVMRQGWQKRWTDEQKAIIRQAVEDHGSDRLNFTYERGPVNPMTEKHVIGYVWFQTESDAVATVIRWAIEKGQLPYITEVTKGADMSFKVGDKIFANTTVGQALAMAEVAATGNTMEPIRATG